jgi:DnaK suppressor protein
MAKKTTAKTTRKAKKSATKKTAKPKTKLSAKATVKTKKKTSAASTKKKSAPVKKKTTASSTKKKAAAAKKKTTMSRRDKLLHKIKQDLLSQRDSLLKEAEETLSTLPGDINFPDMGDQATAETDRNFILRLRDRERMLLKKIEETILRIDNKDYGICEECENEIGIKRLEARPVTALCIDCKTREEEDERIAEGG